MLFCMHILWHHAYAVQVCKVYVLAHWLCVIALQACTYDHAGQLFKAYKEQSADVPVWAHATCMEEDLYSWQDPE